MSDGQGCECAAMDACECCCDDVDWRSSREVELESRAVELEKQRDYLLSALEKQFADAKHCQQVMLNEVGIGFLDVVTLADSEKALAKVKGAA